MVVISSFRAVRRSFSLKACSPRNSMMLACFARFSCSFTTACPASCLSSWRATSPALGAATSNTRARLPKQNRTPYRILGILTKTNQILKHPAIIAADADIANKHKLITYFDFAANLLTTGSRIDGAHVQIEAIKKFVVLGGLTLFKNLPVKLLNQ